MANYRAFHGNIAHVFGSVDQNAPCCSLSLSLSYTTLSPSIRRSTPPLSPPDLTAPLPPAVLHLDGHGRRSYRTVVTRRPVLTHCSSSSSPSPPPPSHCPRTRLPRLFLLPAPSPWSWLCPLLWTCRSTLLYLPSSSLPLTTDHHPFLSAAVASLTRAPKPLPLGQNPASAAEEAVSLKGCRPLPSALLLLLVLFSASSSSALLPPRTQPPPPLPPANAFSSTMAEPLLWTRRSTLLYFPSSSPPPTTDHHPFLPAAIASLTRAPKPLPLGQNLASTAEEAVGLEVARSGKNSCAREGGGGPAGTAVAQELLWQREKGGRV